jgi:hypothetical protein
MAENRRQTGNTGSFQPGQSGNPGGRPKLTPKALEVRAACREASARAVERLTELVEANDPAVALRAISAILEHAWGTPGTEADVRGTDAARAADAYEREHRRRLDWSPHACGRTTARRRLGVLLLHDLYG